MRRFIRDRRGIAMESAILFMVVLFSFSLLLTTVVLTAHSTATANEKTVQRRIEIEEIGEHFLRDTTSSTLFEERVDLSPYTATVTDSEGNAAQDGTVLTLKNAKGSTVLYVEKDAGGRALVWKYSLNQ